MYECKDKIIFSNINNHKFNPKQIIKIIIYS